MTNKKESDILSHRKRKEMTQRKYGIILIALCFLVTKMSGDATGLVIALFLGGAVVLPTRQERKAIIQNIHKRMHKNKTYHYRPAIF